MDRFQLRTTGKLIGGGIVIMPLFFSFSFAQVGGMIRPESVLSLIRKNYNSESSLSTQFALTIFWNVREKQEKKKGSICLAAGNRFRVQAKGESWVSNGQTFWNYSPSSQQVVIKRLTDVDQSSLPSQIFSRYLTVFHFREKEDRDGTAELSWNNDTASGPYTSILLWTHGQTGRIDRCVMTDHNGNTFSYVFSGTVFDRNFSKETFEFAIPKSARIVDMRD
jgi:outer membrane lipoprotein-sorting protein